MFGYQLWTAIDQIKLKGIAMIVGDAFGSTSIARSRGTSATQPRKLKSKLGIEAVMSTPEIADTLRPVK
jgi:hypothetical protein